MKVFDEYYQENFWQGDESVSGQGSDLKQTKEVRKQLPKLFERYGIKTVLDIPCGDFYWVNQMDLPVQYIGADVVRGLIAHNQQRYIGVDFRVLDIAADPLPKVDLVLVRDLLGHFSNADVKRALSNLRLSGSKYLLATTFPGRETSGDIKTGQWRPVNLASFFGLPDPIEVIDEKCTQAGGAFSDKSLGLWRLNEEY